MKEYQKVQPEVIVGIGDETKFLEQQPPFKTVLELHIDLEDWLGDDLMECHPCYIVTEQLKNGLNESSFTGYEFAEMEVTKAEYFTDNYQLKKELPKFFWMKITGKEYLDDIFIGKDLALFLSNEVIDYLKNNFSVNYLDLNTERDELDDLLDQMIADSKANKK